MREAGHECRAFECCAQFQKKERKKEKKSPINKNYFVSLLGCWD